MTDALLQDLWFHQADDVALDTVNIRGDLVAVQAATTTDRADCPSSGTISTRDRSIETVSRRLAGIPASG
ncbi:hypothetical protein [Streptomyces sp. ISL-94]|uniref:hypothetical protein n=1 Tax=Streptomyces sp. ISL-94 TaxID=2819190 RepID=UPI001BECC21A|nr:hypothetical protein [Streptomyces sp. ISL-94]MBT2480099.1 hypothetical protein [Streptomyces sp. ISL-94]